MGILSALFGSKKVEIKDNDGSWLKMERESTWKEVSRFDQNTPIDVSIESCFQSKVGTFCVLRSFNKSQNSILYAGCVLPIDQSEFIQIVVHRSEGLDGEVIIKDVWQKNRILDKEMIPSISDAILTIKNHAVLNNYSTIPPFVYYLTMNLGN